jgi:tetratricopeptide (TPR) repeat protein
MITASIVLLFAAFLVVLAEWRSYRVDRLRSHASLAVRPADAARFLEAAASVRPNDPNVWEELTSAHFQAAAEEGQSALAGLVGFAELGNPSDILPGCDPDHHVTEALRAARAGRSVQPLVAGFHLRLGAFADRFARSEPAQVHFDRAIRVGASLPDVWFISGQAAADRGDWARALADWRESLARSPRRLPVIARAAAGRVAPALLREKALPDDPAAWFVAMPILFADDADPKRAEWLRAIDARCRRAEPETIAGFLAWGSALEELSDAPGAIRAWRRAIERFPDSVPLHDRLATRLEVEELYEEAQPGLEWLAAREPDNGGYRERLAAAKHALKLKADINGR